MSSIILKAEKITKSYTLGGETLHILKGVDISVSQGEMVGIKGASGAGKSTLLHILGLLDKPDSGIVSLNDEKINFGSRLRNAEIRTHGLGFVFQFYHLLPELNSVENVLLKPMINFSLFSWYPRKAKLREEAKELLTSLGLGKRLQHKPPQLSGGERQRVAIARALIFNPDILLCDEPTGNLDEKTSKTISDLLFKINEERKQTMIMVTHNESLAGRMPRLLDLKDGTLNTVSP